MGTWWNKMLNCGQLLKKYWLLPREDETCKRVSIPEVLLYSMLYSAQQDCKYRHLHLMQICCGITCGRVLNGELYAQRLQKLIYLHLFTDCFIIIRTNFFWRLEINLHETVCKQMQINSFCNLWTFTLTLTVLVTTIDALRHFETG